MAFQKTVRRSYPQGFPGEVVFEGPQRGRTARIKASATVPAAPNRVSRAFGFVGEGGTVGTAPANQVYAANLPEVEVGGENFFGILFNPKHYALFGTAVSSLAPNLDLPNGSEGEFTNMVTGLVVELYNFGTAAQEVKYGDHLYYTPGSIDAADNPLAFEPGMIFAVDPEATVPDGAVRIPGIVTNPVSLDASAVGALAGALTIVQLNTL